MRNFKVTVNGVVYDVAIEETAAASVSAPAAPAASAPATAPAMEPVVAPAAASDANAVKAPFPGNVLRVNVKAGDTMKKGDVLAVAQVAGIMAAKKNSELIPMCHTILLTGVDIHFTLEETALHIFSEVRCKGETGVEMEALTAVSVAALTV